MFRSSVGAFCSLAFAAVFALAACPGEPPPSVRPPHPPASANSFPTAPAPRADGRLPPFATPARYALDLTIDPGTARFSGTARIEIDVPAPTAHVVMHGRGLNITDARALVGSEAVVARAETRVSQGGKSPEELVLAFAQPLPAGRHAIVIAYDAPFDNELSGLFRVKDGERWYAFTQFEATDARRAFPCFDEPGFKVPFDVSVTVPKGMMAVANAREASREDKGNKITFRFAQTPALPTYLVAFAVGDFEIKEASRVSKPPIRLVTAKGKSGLGALGLEATGAIVDALGDWFGIPYPYEKLDIVAVPEFGPGAMENPGLVTFREEKLLLDPARASVAARRAQALIVAHELAHQWFGNLVTAAWWNDVWLNEGMATWMESRIVDKWRPAFGARVDAIVSGHGVMDLDGLANARAVRQPVVSTSDAQEAFDGITYTKGAAILSTVERWIGEETFQRGVREYLTENAWKSVHAEKLLATLDRVSGKSVSQMASAYLDKAGVPEVAAKLECEKGSRWHVDLMAEEWKPLGSKKPEAQGDHFWTIPVCVRVQGEKKNLCAELTAGAPSIVAGKGRCPSFVHPNAEGSYYRFALDEKDLVKLAEGRAQLDVGARVSALSNAWAAVRSGKAKPEAILRVLPAFDDDTARQVTDHVVWILGRMSETLVDDVARPAFRKFSTNRLAKRKKELGWKARAGADQAAAGDEALARRVVLMGMGDLAEDDLTLREAEEQATRWLADPSTVDPDVGAIALDLASRKAGEPRLTALRAAAKNAKNREDRLTALRAMMGFDAPDMLGHALDLLLTDEIAAPEVRQMLGSVFSRRSAQPTAEAWVRAHWDALKKKLPGGLGASLIRAAAVGCSQANADERSKFYGPRLADVEGAARGLSEALESISLCAELRDKHEMAMRRALLAQKK